MIPDVGYEVKDVVIDGVSVGAVDSYTFEGISANHTISVTFKKTYGIPQHTITATSGDNGSINPSGEVTVDEGSYQTFVMTPDSGYELEDVEIDGMSLGALDGYTFTDVTNDHTIRATFTKAAVAIENGHLLTTDDLWIRAVIHTVDGPIEALWQKGGEDSTSRGDKVIWGYFYASPDDVTWGNQNNPDLFIKVWLDASGRTDVNFFHVSVPEIEVWSDYPYDGTPDEHGTTTTKLRYIRQYYEVGQSYSEGVEEYDETGEFKGYPPSNNPSGYSVINDLRIGSVISTEEKGGIDGVWYKGGEGTMSDGNQVAWGHFYASPDDVSWGSRNNPDLFVKLWFDASGRIDANFFHVSVPNIEIYSDFPDDGYYEKKGTTTMEGRYIRNVHWRDDPGKQEPPPEAEFKVSTTTGKAPLKVYFTNDSTGGDQCIWDFGDRMTSTEWSPSHIYTESGTYTVTLTVTGPGGSDKATKQIVVTVPDPGDPLLKADFQASQTSGTLRSGRMTVIFTNKSVGNYTSCVWDFGDDTPTSKDRHPTHIYKEPGSYTVTLTIAAPGVFAEPEVKLNYIYVMQEWDPK
ncbi:PKD domain-containing protein [Desulfobacterales bacterium HSG2]|nr:PKD domain-containing protein [Desulfobacterales bacterium HSG2]